MSIPTAWKKQSYIGYFGGQNQCVDLVNALATSQESKKWSEGFGGSGVLTINRDTSFLEESIMIEKSTPVYLMHKMIQSEETFEGYISTICNLVVDREVYNTAKKARENEYIDCKEMDIAVSEYILRTNSFSGIMGNYVERDIYYDNRYTSLMEIHDRYRDCEIVNGDSLPFIKKYAKDSEAFLVLDPPFMEETRASTGQYDFEYTNEQHESLLEILKDAKADIVLMGYDKSLKSGDINLYDRVLKGSKERQWYKFYVVKKDRVSKVDTGKKRNNKKQAMWINFYPHKNVRNNFIELDSLTLL